MKLVEFPQGDNKVLIDPEKVTRVEKDVSASHSNRKDWDHTLVYVSFVGGSGPVVFLGKDAEIAWHYFYNHGLAKPATLD